MVVIAGFRGKLPATPDYRKELLGLLSKACPHLLLSVDKWGYI